MTRQPDLPDLGSGPAFEHTLLARAFRLLLDDSQPVSSAWCPMVNFFEHAEAAQAWAAEHRGCDTAVPLAQATDQGKVAWRRWIATKSTASRPTR
jgi:Alkylmercury lyase